MDKTIKIDAASDTVPNFSSTALSKEAFKLNEKMNKHLVSPEFVRAMSEFTESYIGCLYRNIGKKHGQ